MNSKLALGIGLAVSIAVAQETREMQLQGITAIGSGGEGVDVEHSEIDVRQIDSVSELLRDVPGVSGAGSNAFNQRIEMRGISHHGLNVQIDGARQIGMIFHHQDTLMVDPGILKGVKVEPGVVSVIGNAGALGGSVKFKTLSARDLLLPGQGFGYKLRASFESNTRSPGLGLTAYTRSGSVGTLLYVSGRWHDFGKTGDHIWLQPGNNKRHAYKDGKVDHKPVYVNALNRVPKRTGGRGVNLSALAKFDVYTSDSDVFSVNAQIQSDFGVYPFKSDFPATNLSKIGDAVYYKQAMTRYTVATSYDAQLSRSFSVDWNAYYNLVRLQRGGIAIGIVKSRSVNGKTEIPDTNKSQISTHNYGSKLIFSNTFNRSNKLSYGLEYFATEQHPDYFIKHIESKPDNVRRMSTAAHDVAHSVSVFLEHKYTMFLGNEATLDLVPGVRYDFYRLTRHIHIPVAVDKHNKVINNFSEVSPAFSAVFKVGSGFRMYGNYARLFKGPPVTEGIFLGGDSKIKGNAHMKSETGDSFGAGMNLRVGSGSVRSDFMIRSFYTMYYNLASHDRGSKANVSGNHLKSYGGEASVKVYLGDMSTKFSYTKVDSKMLEPKGSKSITNDVRSGMSNGRVVGDKYTLNLEYFMHRIGLTLGMNNTAYAPKDVTLPGGAVRDTKEIASYYKEHFPGYYVADIYMIWEPTSMDSISMTLGAYNLFNEAYIQQNSRYWGEGDYQPGLNIKASLTYKY